MAPPSHESSCISRRPVSSLPVLTRAMSLRSRRAEHPTVTLELPQLDRCHDRAEKALSQTIAAYAKLESKVDTTRWKSIRSRGGVRLFRGRQLNCEGQTPLLCMGTLRGRFDDVMEGLYSDSTEEMLLKNAIKCPRLAESAVLYAVQRQTLCEPYAFTGVKWATIKLSVASNRDLCYFDKMGLVRQTSGKRMAYHVMQSVDLPEYSHKSTNKRVQMSLCYLLEELEDDMVGVYMQGEINYSAMSCFATPAVSEMLLAIANTLECTRAKKLLLMMSRPGGLRNNSSQKNCAYCKGSSSFFKSLENCAGCNKHVCKKCRSSEHVLAREGCHLKRAEFCRKCTYKTSKSSLDQVAIEASGYNVAGLAHKASFITIEEETEDAKVDIHGSDRSLTSFVRKISAQMQELSTPGDFRASSLSLIGGLSEDEEREGEDVLNASRLKSGAFMVLDSHLPSRSRSSTTSTASSSYGRDEEDPEQFHATLFARLQQVSQQAEETWFLAREQSIVANSVRQRSQRRAQSYA